VQKFHVNLQKPTCQTKNYCQIRGKSKLIIVMIDKNDKKLAAVIKKCYIEMIFILGVFLWKKIL